MQILKCIATSKNLYVTKLILNIGLPRYFNRLYMYNLLIYKIITLQFIIEKISIGEYTM